jgi:hypothetical protein
MTKIKRDILKLLFCKYKVSELFIVSRLEFRNFFSSYKNFSIGA